MHVDDSARAYCVQFQQKVFDLGSSSVRSAFKPHTVHASFVFTFQSRATSATKKVIGLTENTRTNRHPVLQSYRSNSRTQGVIRKRGGPTVEYNGTL